MFAQKFFRHTDILVGNLFRIHRRELLVQTRFYQILAVERAIHGYFAFVAAANGTDVAAHSRAMTARLACLANLAFHNNASIVTSRFSFLVSRWGRGPRTRNEELGTGERLLILAQEETIGHSGNVIAHHAM